MKQKIITGVLALCILFGTRSAVYAVSDMPGSDPAASEDMQVPDGAPVPIYIKAPSTGKASAKSIKISWGSSKDGSVITYYVMRRSTKNCIGKGKWKTIAEVNSDGVKGGAKNSYTDRLDSSIAQQYEYKICTTSVDGVDTRSESYADETDQYAVLGTNIKICIDAGHYGSINNNFELSGKNGKYPFSEAEFNLRVAIALQKELKQSYGISSYMNRSKSAISLDWNGQKYVDSNLDNRFISIRGRMAKAHGCDFFISLHTNSTSRQENPWNQPKSMNKTFVFVNKAAHGSDVGMEIANAIGAGISDYNKEVGISSSGFVARSKNDAPDFSNQVNDAVNTDGTVIYRRNSTGGDYYGVLRGANEDGIQAVLVEHAFHVTQIVRKLAEESTELCDGWAACDAFGIACGFGFANNLS